MKKMIIIALMALSIFSGCATVSTPPLYIQNKETHRWYNIYEARTCMKGKVLSYKTGALQCYVNGKKAHVIYPVTQAQRSRDRQVSMAQLQMQQQNMNSLTNQLNEVAKTQAINNMAIANMGRPVYNIYGY